MAIDSGLLIAVFSLGWLGSALFGAGIGSRCSCRKDKRWRSVTNSLESAKRP